MAKHTPGTWEVAGNCIRTPTVVNDRGGIEGGHLIAECSVHWPMAEHRANARLIAAAPAMLEALECLLPGLVIDLRYAPPDDDFDALRSRIKTVTDAIAKATGGDGNG